MVIIVPDEALNRYLKMSARYSRKNVVLSEETPQGATLERNWKADIRRLILEGVDEGDVGR